MLKTMNMLVGPMDLIIIYWLINVAPSREEIKINGIAPKTTVNTAQTVAASTTITQLIQFVFQPKTTGR